MHYMAIILLPLSSRQLYAQLSAGSPVCPVDPNHPLVKNGTYTRHADSIAPDALLIIQRYLCRVCATTYSALPYDLRPYSTATWGVTLAVGAVWRVEFQWTWKDCLAWLAVHHLPYHLRTLQRWAARWRRAEPHIVRTALQWIAAQYGTRAGAVWPAATEAPVSHWRRLWRLGRNLATDPAARHGGWLAGSVLWGWLSITVFAGLPSG